jgi:hypothetical protein
MDGISELPVYRVTKGTGPTAEADSVPQGILREGACYTHAHHASQSRAEQSRAEQGR